MALLPRITRIWSFGFSTLILIGFSAHAYDRPGSVEKLYQYSGSSLPWQPASNPNGFGDVVLNVVEQGQQKILYRKGSESISSAFLSSQLPGVSFAARQLNDAGDVLLEATNSSGGFAGFKLWRTSRAQSGHTILSTPLPVGASVQLNQQGDLAWRDPGYVSSSSFWSPGNPNATLLPGPLNSPSDGWPYNGLMFLLNRTDPQNPLTASIVIRRSATHIAIWRPSTNSSTQISGFPVNATWVGVSGFGDNGDLVGNVVTPAGVFLWFYRTTTQSVFVSTQYRSAVPTQTAGAISASGHVIAQRLSDQKLGILRLQAVAGNLTETFEPLSTSSIPGIASFEWRESSRLTPAGDAVYLVGRDLSSCDHHILWFRDATGGFSSPARLQFLAPTHEGWALSKPVAFGAQGQLLGVGVYASRQVFWRFTPIADFDFDGLPDAWETLQRTNPSFVDANADPDNDGLSNLGEYHAGTGAQTPDSDADGLPDGWEDQYGYDPKLAADAAYDVDNDGLTTLQEYTAGTNASARFVVEPLDLPPTINPFYFAAAVDLNNRSLDGRIQLAINVPFVIEALGDDYGWESNSAYRLTLASAGPGWLGIPGWYNSYYFIPGYPDLVSHATRINNQGLISGYARVSFENWQAFVWSPPLSTGDGKIMIQGVPVGISANTYSYALSSGNVTNVSVVGMWQSRYDWKTGPFFWSAGNGTQRLFNIAPTNPPGGYNKLSTVTINPSGTLVAGGYEDASYRTRGFLWDPSQIPPAGFSFPPLPDGQDYTFIAVNNQGDRLGVRFGANYLDWDFHALLWKGGQPAPALIGTLGGISLNPKALNNAGEVVGSSLTRSGAEHGFLRTSDGRLLDLNKLIQNPSNQWEITDAHAINDTGEILASAIQYSLSGTKNREVLLRPTNQDTDGDGLPDDWERYYFGNLNQNANGDSDRDGLTNLQEWIASTNPLHADSDGDAMGDAYEVLNGLNPQASDGSLDLDGDGIANREDARPSDPSTGRISIIITTPSNNSILP